MIRYNIDVIGSSLLCHDTVTTMLEASIASRPPVRSWLCFSGDVFFAVLIRLLLEEELHYAAILVEQAAGAGSRRHSASIPIILFVTVLAGTISWGIRAARFSKCM